mmetsp:Transcript_660/g.1526  ORF Transcript_660/g.1526 Transcript_660/m.1526 type:complete len:214 (+) Transcript_660:707-1348(+)
MEASNTNIERKVSSVCQGHFLRIQLLQPVHILRTGRPGITLDQSGVLGILLLRFIVDTRRRRVEEVLALTTPCRLEHIHRNGRVVEAQDTFVRADEAHASHISCQVVHLETILACLHCHLELTQIVQDKLITEFVLLHEFILLPVNDGDFVSSFFEALGDVRADEACSASYADFSAIAGWECPCFVFGHVELFCCCLFGRSWWKRWVGAGCFI